MHCLNIWQLLNFLFVKIWQKKLNKKNPFVGFNSFFLSLGCENLLKNKTSPKIKIGIQN
jgi:hypothetical protein